MKTNRLFKFCAFVLATCFFTSCIDEKYDLDNVDMTIGTSGNLTLPTSSTGEIVLKNLMDLKEDGVVQIINGEYFIVENGSANIPSIDITSIVINKPELSPIVANIHIDAPLPSRSTSVARAGISIGGIELPDLPNFTYTYSITDKDKAYYELDNAVSSTVPKEVVELTSVSFADNTTLDAKVQISFDSEIKFVKKVHLDNLTLQIPVGLSVSSAEFAHWTFKGGKEVLEVVEAKSIDNTKGIIVLTETDENTIIDEDHEIHIRITFDKAITGDAGFTFVDGHVSLSGLFKIGGTFRLESNDFNLEALTMEQALRVYQTGNYDAICPTTLDFNGTASFENNIEVTGFAGKVQADAGNIAPIKLNDLPDFLNDPAVVLDLANPALFVEVDYPLPSDAQTSITLTGVYTDGTAPVVKGTGMVTIPANGHVVFCIAGKPEEVTAIPQEYASLTVIPVTVEGLNELFKKLPDEIKVEVEDITMETENMPIPANYGVKVNYNVYTPLTFGEEFVLVYQGTEEGLGDDLEDLDKLDTKAVRIDATVVTNFPLSLTLSVDALDRYNNSMNGSVVDVSDIVIEAHKGPDATSSQPISIEIIPLQGHTIGEMLGRLDKFHYRAVAEADGEGTLKEDASIKLEDIKITLVGGISYDAN